MKYLIAIVTYILPMLAFAQDTALVGTSPATPGAGEPGGIGSLMVQLGIIFLIFYFLLIRPQQKKFKEHSQMISALKKGDKVITGGGFVGTITKSVEGDKFIDVEIANGVVVQVLRSTVTDMADAVNKVEIKAEKKK